MTTDPTSTLVAEIEALDYFWQTRPGPTLIGLDAATAIATRHEQAWHAERQRLTEELAARKRCDAYNRYERSTLYKERDTLRARVRELEDRLTVAAPMLCPECGPHVAIDEDGCCATCGADTTYICPAEKGTER